MQVKIKVGGQTLTRTVTRSQYPITAAYAFTDYRTQGQTIRPVLVDIATPPTGGLSLTALYVALSRKPELMQEDDRLERLDQVTKVWWSRMSAVP
ncbi:hypothetical protein K435DRAFT_700675 [Dendrothele bispora CBS 962.96]|uniref:Uncharacterized protein n=1 Tax=Dendrothele bispora (strain CBS 962.96) TaxID=1314807 RepID=A0A4S8KS17_DENBC|nr:hypothetical protein K435DRAFT_700675 [Dendrothele bispora CBS 962.96]